MQIVDLCQSARLKSRTGWGCAWCWPRASSSWRACTISSSCSRVASPSTSDLHADGLKAHLLRGLLQRATGPPGGGVADVDLPDGLRVLVSFTPFSRWPRRSRRRRGSRPGPTARSRRARARCPGRTEVQGLVHHHGRVVVTHVAQRAVLALPSRCGPCWCPGEAGLALRLLGGKGGQTGCVDGARIGFDGGGVLFLGWRVWWRAMPC
jgi:hypothetical protein